MKEARPGSLGAPGRGGVGEESVGSQSRTLLAAEPREWHCWAIKWKFRTARYAHFESNRSNLKILLGNGKLF